ncbi:MAG TPA: TetM/TetW/TetO/TetS family tetracycline resistance ribosomal protection protein [Candidatus Blautia pullicola]|uniref:TetM/TetW/TetO/TetS family tetracycline resistance ribosomal protection protein n=1 Tax=Candidatus Blautia pullicola TaxID=2838498 RepID=A0A9D2JT71_9FIRM|nr:TetM/TetW/TetO/TetS family tetracycline resistance ribosomal protection protein [Candidatus Blautia pullicola]
MENTSGNRENKRTERPSKHICIGLLAHVDAGKTTLAESLLYHTGSIRKMGRVDHRDAFLDTYELERARGITIFSKQAGLQLGNREVTLLDTPGHVDFSAEMERTLQVLDYAVLVISGADGVQGHVETLWKLLKQYGVPVFLFVNKMDQEGADRERLLEELKTRLSDRCVDFGQERQRESFLEEIAMCEENALELFLEQGDIDTREIARLIARRKVFPCWFGSALKSIGIEEFLTALDKYILSPSYSENFAARVYKISRDEKGNRLTHMKITGGALKVKQLLKGKDWEEKADQIRVYDGAGFQAVNQAEAGVICAVTGLSHTFAGEGLGEEKGEIQPVLTPVLNYEIQLPQGTDVHGMLLKLRQLEEEIPELQIVWKEQLGEIHAQVMGAVQIEILKEMIEERYGLQVEFGSGNIVYKETIENRVEGIGHFEPLRHYAEVHLLLEPLERGQGLVFETDCSEDVLDRNWQRLVLTHLEEKKHVGVLTGSEITDMKVTLIAGRAHLKHTEGGDFRQATYRALRQGLRKAKSLLLEPVYEYRLEVPQDMVGRAMADIQKMSGSFAPPESEGDMAVLAGTAPVSEMGGYQAEVTSYTRGRGRLSCTLKGYEPCHNSEEVIDTLAYDPEADIENPTGSVFCAHGAGFVVSWDKVEEYAHIDTGLELEKEEPKEEYHVPAGKSFSQMRLDEKELEEIFARTYGSVKRERNAFAKTLRAASYDSGSRGKKKEPEKEYLLVDGYNIIFAWEDLNQLAKVNIEGARNKLMDILCNYQGYKKCTLILVFDAYKVEGNQGEVQKYHNIHVVYTREAETADQYIEKTVHEIGRKYQVTVATSDALEQVIILGQGAARMSAANLREEVELMNQEIREHYIEKTKKSSTYLFENLSGDLSELMEDVRLGRKKLD